MPILLNPKTKLAALRLIENLTGKDTLISMRIAESLWKEFNEINANKFRLLGGGHFLAWIRKKYGGEENGPEDEEGN